MNDMLRRQNHLEIFSNCSVCKNKLNRQDLTLVLEQNSKSVFHVSCSKCHTSVLILFSRGQEGILSVGMITDLNREEAIEKLKPSEITANEMIEIYETVRKM